MKKVLSLLLSFAMLISCMAFGGVNAFAATKAKVAERKAGETFSITAKPLDFEKLFDTDESKLDIYFAKFTPASAGWYEFVFDTAFKDKSEMGVLSVGIIDSSEEMVADSTADGSLADGEVNNLLGEEVTNNPSLTAELKAKKTYYLVVMNMGEATYKSNVTINKHTHKMSYVDKKVKVEAIDLGEFGTMLVSNEGFRGNACEDAYCQYKEPEVEYPSVISAETKKSSYTYTGKQIKPAVTILTSEYKKLGADSYSVEYNDNTKIGTAKIHITFKGNYEGSVTLKFSIIPKGTTVKSVTGKKQAATVKWKKQANNTTGYQIQYSTKKNFKGAKKLNVKGAKKTSATIKKLKSGKKYYVRIRTYKKVGKKTYYSSWSKKKAVTVK